MIVVMKSGSSESDINEVVSRLEQSGLAAHLSQGAERTVIGVVGAVQSHPELRNVLALVSGVQEVIPISKPYKLAGREFQPHDTVIDVGGISIGNGSKDGAQSLTFENFAKLMSVLELVANAVGRQIAKAK